MNADNLVSEFPGVLRSYYIKDIVVNFDSFQFINVFFIPCVNQRLSAAK